MSSRLRTFLPSLALAFIPWVFQSGRLCHPGVPPPILVRFHTGSPVAMGFNRWSLTPNYNNNPRLSIRAFGRSIIFMDQPGRWHSLFSSKNNPLSMHGSTSKFSVLFGQAVCYICQGHSWLSAWLLSSIIWNPSNWYMCEGFFLIKSLGVGQPTFNPNLLKWEDPS